MLYLQFNHLIMRMYNKPLLISAFFMTLFAVSAQGEELDKITEKPLTEFVNGLYGTKYYNDSLKFVVGMPQLADDVVYSVKLKQFPDSNTRLSPCAYLIEWELTGKDTAPSGFSSYFDGNHYRYSGSRLQEYHWSWDSIPFIPAQADGIQKTAQFADLLPAMLAEKLLKMIDDPNYEVKFYADTIVGGKTMTAIRASMTINGVTASEQEYIFDPATKLPWRLHFENSPGSISEQTVDVIYSGAPSSNPGTENFNEEYLMGLYPDVFSNFRESNFRIENLPGNRLPSFSLPVVGGDRLSYRSGDTFSNPVLLAILDPDGGFNIDYIEALRSAVSSLPIQADLIFAFTGTNADRIEEQTGSNPSETVLMSGKGLARDCGVSSFPVALIVGKDGKVKDVVLGYNNNLSSDLIQKMALMDN